VSVPENIRIRLVASIPIPPVPILKEACTQTGLITSNTIGLTLNYGIYIRQDQIANIGLHAHEFKHVAQYERLGSIEEFLSCYLQEVIKYGYHQRYTRMLWFE